ncbi:hypothetical protein ATCC90586_004876 [Pythium insidiosum]|nr:hypothetical protein ATCC90586_004876 [Pythium insidiosum]
MSLSNAAAKLADDVLGKRKVAETTTQPEGSAHGTMKAIVWRGANKVELVDVPKPAITHPQDAVVRVTACSICSGSDSHLYSGEVAPMDDGGILGHEACGVVDAVGDGVQRFKRGDRVVISFCVACGDCEYCQRGEFTACDRTNDSTLFEELYGGHAAAAIFGYSRLMGNLPGSQAEFVRVPFADVNLCAIPDDVPDEKALYVSDFVRVPFADVNLCAIPDDVPDEKALYVSDVLATSLHATELGSVGRGDTVAIWGLGPIGLYAAAWSKLKGAARVFGIDLVPERLALARDAIGIEVLDRSDLSSAQVLAKLRDLLPGRGAVDVCIDATGFRFSESWLHKVERTVGLETDTPDILVECVSLVRKFGRVAVIADYVGYANHFPIGHVMMKHLTLRAGQCPVQRYFKRCPVQRYFKRVMQALQAGEIDPTLMITYRLTLEEVPSAYEQLFHKKEGYVKVLITPKKPEEHGSEEHP